ncbi:GntR family transcriptional regulator [Sediminivirga luteola]|uniref:GntR family transcriptional regulator n=1 Tax=Sediminivirga luteola TaxID=1774748 RepID=A0A8J2TV67_9MICO|nr:GntR family transcriptional regulator [Sediminivirga luteola]GGA02585.1 GntR family transcriptional regulator [Sediminivirga luteola]
MSRSDHPTIEWGALRLIGTPEHAHGPDRVADALRRTISEGRIPPGAKLPEIRLTEELRVSRHTLRSAFRILAGEGLVERRPNVGVFVLSPTAEDVREIYRVRRIVETGAVRSSEFPAEAISALRDIVAQAAAAREVENTFLMTEANQDFHRTIVAQVRSDMLDALMERILARMRLVFAIMGGDPGFHNDYPRQNAELVELIAAGRRQDAERYLSDYLTRAEGDLLEHFADPPR